MSRSSGRRPGFGAGLAAGLLLGVAVMIAAFSFIRLLDGGDARVAPTLLHAAATHGGDSFAMATGPVSEDVEGVFFLDFLTGDLQCWVINSRTGKFAGRFRHNVVKDLKVKRGKAPRYLIATGRANFRGGGALNYVGASVLYVADVNTGLVAAYAVPWDRNAEASGRAQQGGFILMDGGKARYLEVE